MSGLLTNVPESWAVAPALLEPAPVCWSRPPTVVPPCRPARAFEQLPAAVPP